MAQKYCSYEHKLTKQELDIIAVDIADKTQDNLHAASTIEECKALVKSNNSLIARLTQQRENGIELREVLCNTVINRTTRLIEYVATEGNLIGEVIESEPLEGYQSEIDDILRGDGEDE